MVKELGESKLTHIAETNVKSKAELLRYKLDLDEEHSQLLKEIDDFEHRKIDKSRLTDSESKKQRHYIATLMKAGLAINNKRIRDTISTLKSFTIVVPA